MRSKFKWIFTLLVALTMQLSFAQEKTVKGIVTDASGPMPGVNVVVKGTQRGVSTGFDGAYSIKASEGEVLVFSFMGMNDIVRTVDASSVVNVKMQEDAKKLETVVITAMGIKTSSKKTTAAMQEVKAKDLNITQSNDIRASLTGKVAGVQNVAQAGSKLGSTGTLRLRGAMALNGADNDALYVIDGVISSADLVDPENVESINVLKGPNATALFGSQGINGVIMITTKKGKKETITVELFNSTTFDKVAYLPKYQNLYGQGYTGYDGTTWDTMSSWLDPSNPYQPAEWANLPQDVRLNMEGDADESWGAKFDGQPYLPWYTLHANSPYFGQPQAYTAQKDNVKDFYDTGLNVKNGVTISGGGDKFTARLNYTKSSQKGIIPTSTFDKDLLSASFNSEISSRLKLGINATYAKSKAVGDFDDEYGNQTSGSFNSWFGRDLDINKLRELKNLKTSRGTTYGGYAASWNYWSPVYYDPASVGLTFVNNDGAYKSVFWHNPYFFLDNSKPESVNDRFLTDINASYKINKNITANVLASKNYRKNSYEWKVPFELQYNAAHNLYTQDVNSFGYTYTTQNTNTIQSSIDVNYKLTNDLNWKNTFGHIFRDTDSEVLSANMAASGNILAGSQVGLVIPDYYAFENSRQRINSTRRFNPWRSNAFYSRTTLDFKEFLSLNLDVTSEWNSKFDYSGANNNNGVVYGSLGMSFLFSELVKWDKLNTGKLFGSYAKTAPEVAAQYLNPGFNVGTTQSYNNNPLMTTPSYGVVPGLTPYSSPSLEVGMDLKMFDNRVRLNTVYYNEVRENQIINVGVSSATSYVAVGNQSGKTSRKGIEAVLGLTPFKTDKFSWDMTLSVAANKSMVDAVAPDTEAFQVDVASFDGIALVNYAGQEWGQLVGNGIKRDASGNKVVDANGFYVTESNVKFGSVLPDFTGGLLNRFEYKNFTLAGTLAFQKGGKFFSLSERWGQYSGLLEETAALNDRGANVRDLVYNPAAPVAGEDGGVRVDGVDSTTGAPVTTYVEAQAYFNQFHNNNIAEGFVHDASYIKLSDVSLSYNLPSKLFNNKIQNISIGLVARNLFRFGMSKDNKHGWDSSEMSKLYGENGQLPGTKSYGFNVKITL